MTPPPLDLPLRWFSCTSQLTLVLCAFWRSEECHRKFGMMTAVAPSAPACSNHCHLRLWAHSVFAFGGNIHYCEWKISKSRYAFWASMEGRGCTASKNYDVIPSIASIVQYILETPTCIRFPSGRSRVQRTWKHWRTSWCRHVQSSSTCTSRPAARTSWFSCGDRHLLWLALVRDNQSEWLSAPRSILCLFILWEWWEIGMSAHPFPFFRKHATFNKKIQGLWTPFP